MKETIAKFELILATAPRKLVDISEADAAHKSGPDRWSKKEIIGHLIDSAGNNHQRFVRCQFTPRLEFPEYDQNPWVERQAYATEPWPDLVNLWLLLNRHLLHIVKSTPPHVYAHELLIGHHPPMTFEALVPSYLKHLEHHLAQIYS
jgi:hypothetical protein